MNVELTIQEMFDKYPILFKERADCLNHLFCVVGNGYEWSNGELVDNYRDLTDSYIDRLRSRLVDGKAHQYKKLSLRAESQFYEDEKIAEGWYEHLAEKYPDIDIRYLMEATQRVIDTYPDDVYYREPVRMKRWSFYINIPGYERIHFSTEFAFLFNYPDNITSDWKGAIDECKKLLIEDGFELPETT